MKSRLPSIPFFTVLRIPFLLVRLTCMVTSAGYRHRLTNNPASIRNYMNNYMVQPWVHLSPMSLQISTWNTESLAIPTSPTLIKWWFRYVDDVHSATRKGQVNKLQEHLNSIDPHIKFTIELTGTDELPFLDTLTKPFLTPLNPQSTENPPTQIGTYITTLSTPFQQNYPLSTLSCTELNRYVLHLNF